MLGFFFENLLGKVWGLSKTFWVLGTAPAEPAPPSRARDGSYQILFDINQSSADRVLLYKSQFINFSKNSAFFENLW
jgi:hypothetical protein